MRYIVYRDRTNFWRWQLVAANNRIVADSGEGYVNKADCLAGITLANSSTSVPVYER